MLKRLGWKIKDLNQPTPSIPSKPTGMIWEELQTGNSLVIQRSGKLFFFLFYREKWVKNSQIYMCDQVKRHLFTKTKFFDKSKRNIHKVLGAAFRFTQSNCGRYFFYPWISVCWNIVFCNFIRVCILFISSVRICLPYVKTFIQPYSTYTWHCKVFASLSLAHFPVFITLRVRILVIRKP